MIPERQRTIRATLDWSYGLLGNREQSLMGRLGAFVGGFSLEAAEAVGATGDVDAGDVLDQLGNLVEQSLVIAEPRAGGAGIRYGMLEPVRQYALEKLEEGGEEEAVRGRHAAYHIALAEQAAAGLWGRGQGEWLETLERENGNLRAAISWALSAKGDPEVAARFCWALWLFWWARGHHGEGHRWTEATLAHPLSPARRARILPVAAAMFYAENDHATAEKRWREGLLVALGEGDPLAEGYSRAGLGLAEMARGNPEAAARSFDEALPLVEECGDPLVSLVRVWRGTTRSYAATQEGRRRRSARVWIRPGPAGTRSTPTWRSTTWPNWRSPDRTSKGRRPPWRRTWSSPDTPGTGRTSRTFWRRSPPSRCCAETPGGRRS